ncbi:MAG TPA: tRNA lysidine(34) synthetase TilS [Pyrinomonadaceae bacterium]|nr:tRNA lysidine(34) synthetase TilS [Pyrinomonadaceae bacterium]
MTKSITPKRPSAKLKTSAKPIRLSAFARRLLMAWRGLELPVNNAAVIVAVSGGADSVALLAGLDELIKSQKLDVRLIVAHLNHKLRGEASDADARWVSKFSRQLGYQFIGRSVDVKRLSKRTSDNLEQAARRARYDFLKRSATSHKAKLVLTAHTLDDQAETVLLNLLRGSGTDGLAGMEPVRKFDPKSDLIVARPLLGWAKRSDTENLCRARGIDFRLDQMNANEAFARVRVRAQLLPLLKTFNPKAEEAISRAAEILREDNLALEAAAGRLIEYSGAAPSSSNQKQAAIRADLLRIAQPALRRRALRQWLSVNRGDLRRLERAHISAIENLLFSPKSGRLVELPGGGVVTRKAGCLHYDGKKRERRTKKRTHT